MSLPFVDKPENIRRWLAVKGVPDGSVYDMLKYYFTIKSGMNGNSPENGSLHDLMMNALRDYEGESVFEKLSWHFLEVVNNPQFSSRDDCERIFWSDDTLDFIPYV